MKNPYFADNDCMLPATNTARLGPSRWLSVMVAVAFVLLLVRMIGVVFPTQ